MKHTMLAVDMVGNAYEITNRDGRIGFGTLMSRAYDRGLRLCIITDGQVMYHARYDSWTAPAWVHAIQPDARLNRSVRDTVAAIRGTAAILDL